MTRLVLPGREYDTYRRSPVFGEEHLIYLTAFLETSASAAIDRSAESLRLHEAIRAALDTAAIRADIKVRFSAGNLVVIVHVDDAERAFPLVEPVFRSSASCAHGFVLVRYGSPGASERQMNLSTESELGEPSMEARMPERAATPRRSW